MAEFDQWVTPSLGDIRDTDKFKAALSSLRRVIEGIAAVATGGDASYRDALRSEMVRELRESSAQDESPRLIDVFTALFLVTAKSDNAVKCQFPLYFRRVHGDTYPKVVGRKLVFDRAPDVVKSVDVVKAALRVKVIDEAIAIRFLETYADFLLADETDRRQFRALVEAYAHSDALPGMSGRDLLAPLVAFQVRGSVAASGGHDPEQIVRVQLQSWGLVPDSHFNRSDITAASLNNWLVMQGDTGGGRTTLDRSTDKTRAFDFILPCHVVDSARRVLIQSQFYAGDSGSVSHKNVDQASNARAYAATLFADARFVELVDGAGYCASLRKDLRHLLFAADTDDFVQLRSIPVRLRRILQESGVLAPLDIALLVAEGVTHLDDLVATVVGRHGEKAAAWIAFAQEADWIVIDGGGRLTVAPSHAAIVERYATLDAIVAAGASLSPDSASGDYLLVPGFGPSFGTLADPSWRSDVIASLVDAGTVMPWSKV